MRWVLGCCVLLWSACQCGAPPATVIVVPLPIVPVAETAPMAPVAEAATAPRPATVAAPATVAGPGWVEQLDDADRASRAGGEPAASTPVAVVEPAELAAGTPIAIASETESESESETEAETEAAVPPAPAVVVAAREPIPWLEQYRADYYDRQIALSDVTVKVANPEFGVYVEDYRALGAEVGTPHQRWLAARDMMVVSPSVEALLLGRNSELLGQVPSFTCDPSRYACLSLAGAPVQAYYRFAPFGPARTVRLVGVLYFDPGVAGAVITGRINDFNRVIDRQLGNLR